MGAWGSGPFENDDASDWVAELEDHGVDALVEALDLPDGYVEAPEAAEALAAAAVVGLVRGVDVTSSPEVDEWLAVADTSAVAELAPRAADALDRVLDSELSELWGEAGDDGWQQQVTSWRDALRGPAQ